MTLSILPGSSWISKQKTSLLNCFYGQFVIRCTGCRYLLILIRDISSRVSLLFVGYFISNSSIHDVIYTHGLNLCHVSFNTVTIIKRPSTPFVLLENGKKTSYLPRLSLTRDFSWSKRVISEWKKRISSGRSSQVSGLRFSQRFEPKVSMIVRKKWN